jgi:trk system potassium uptake protein TrkA
MHIIILGAGDVGSYIANRLAAEEHDVVLVDIKNERLRALNEQIDVRTLQGTASSPKVLVEAGVSNSDMVLAVTDNDEANLLACYFAKILNPQTNRIARIRSQDYLAFIDKKGIEAFNINAYITPEYEVAKQIVNLLKVPAANSVDEFVGGKVKFLGLKIPATSPMAGKNLAQLHTLDAPPFLIAAIERFGKLVIPGGNDLLHMGDLAYIVVGSTDLNWICAHFGVVNDQVKHVSIIGVNAITQQILNICRNMGTDIQISILDNVPERCALLANEFPDHLVLCGNASDIRLLEEENLGRSDLFCAITEHEEDNVLIALLGKKLGARRVVARVGNSGYMPLASSLGVDLIVNPCVAAAGAVLRHLRKGEILNIAPLHDEHAEIIEFLTTEKSRLAGVPLKDLKIPSGILLGAVVRGNEVIIPSGNTVIAPGDRLVIFLMRAMIRRLEKLLDNEIDLF